MTPPIGQVVLRLSQGVWVKDWVAQVRLGDEQHVLVWGACGLRHLSGVSQWVDVSMGLPYPDLQPAK